MKSFVNIDKQALLEKICEQSPCNPGQCFICFYLYRKTGKLYAIIYSSTKLESYKVGINDIPNIKGKTTEVDIKVRSMKLNADRLNSIPWDLEGLGKF